LPQEDRGFESAFLQRGVCEPSASRYRSLFRSDRRRDTCGWRCSKGAHFFAAQRVGPRQQARAGARASWVATDATRDSSSRS
jgi:hypothetical protein